MIELSPVPGRTRPGTDPSPGSAAELLAARAGGAVLVCGPDGRLRHHEVAAAHTPAVSVVTAIVRRDTAGLLPPGWPEACRRAWAEAPLPEGTFYHRLMPSGTPLAVLVTGSPAARLADIVDLLDAIGTAFGQERPRTPAESALLRLVDGAGTGADVSLLDVPVRGARLVAVTRGADGDERLMTALGAIRGVVPAAHRSGHVIILVRGLPRRVREDGALRLVPAVAGAAHRDDPGRRVGVSAPLADAAELPLALADCVDAAAVATDGAAAYACADSVWANITLHRLRGILPRYLTLANPLRQLREYDVKHGCDLIGTVGMWLRNNGDTTKTARDLAIHPNTLRYRLRRAEEVAGLDMSNPDHRALAHLSSRP